MEPFEKRAANLQPVWNWLKMRKELIFIAYAVWNFLILTFLVALLGIAGITGSIVAGALGAIWAAGMTTITLVVGLLALTRGKELPRAWARLQGCDPKRGPYVATSAGEPRLDQIASSREDERLPPLEPPETSMAMSPDGSILATLVGQELRIWTVDAVVGKIDPWSDCIQINSPSGFTKPSILAVARCGDLNAWCACGYETHHGAYQVFWTRVAKAGVVSKFAAVGEDQYKKQPYAVFLGDRLQFISQSDWKVKEILCRQEEVHDGEESATTVRTYGGTFDNVNVIAMDAATLGGRTYVALLVEDQVPGGDRHEPKTKLVVMPDDSKEIVMRADCDVKKGSSHVTMLRAPCGDPTHATIYSVAGNVVTVYDYAYKLGEVPSAQLSKRRRLFAGARFRQRRLGAPSV